jgi:Uma2 family endonuclease
MSAQPILTYDDYIALPEDGPRYELYDGRLIVMPPTSPCHQAVIVNLFIAVAGHVWRHGLGDVCPAPIDVLLSRITVLQPDLVYLDAAGPGLLTEGPIVGTPTLVVEVLAPPTDAWDRGVKQALYARYGVPYYWIVDRRRDPSRSFVSAESHTRWSPGSTRGRVRPCRRWPGSRSIPPPSGRNPSPDARAAERLRSPLVAPSRDIIAISARRATAWPRS